jgi:uncharacterized protein (TIGR00375 family)
MTIKEIARYARIKGLNLVGTGDFTHPEWFEELQRTLVYEPESSLYKTAEPSTSSVYFMITTEVCTVFPYENETKKIHHVILTPNLETATQINDRLRKHGDLTIDGRPTLSMSAPSLVEEVMEVSDQNMVFPAHAWTPWFSLFGAFSGFNSIDECYQDMTKHIHALETGLSSDPPMNWRLSKLDRFTLVSNSDSHSFWPWRIGREANVFELEKTSYRSVVDAIRLKDTEHFKFTIETDPSYGKYHWTGHRNCHVSLSPTEALKFGNVCPVCRRQLTKGVEQRVEELADRAEGFKPDNSIGFMRLLPLSEIITTVLDVDSPSAKNVWAVYDLLIAKYGDEYRVLMEAPFRELVDIVDASVAAAIVRVREGSVRVIPGYDGVYGRLLVGSENSGVRAVATRVEQSNLTDFI